MNPITGDFITLARVVKTQGRHGEVAAEIHSDVPGRFHEGMKLWALREDSERRELKLENFWPHKGGLVLKFVDVDSISDAEALLKCELQVPKAERAELEDGWNYVSDLAGLLVFDGDREIGIVEDVQFGAGEAPLLIVKSGETRYEIPYAEAYIRSVDLAQKKIVMQLPEGMLELNAPLTAEEKALNRRER
ncbi:MAG: ribosome maturation factor RimM [Terriglobales bacterium]